MSKLSLFHVFRSVLAAGIGVQSEKNRKIDFEQGTLSHYLIVGLIVTILFVFTLVSIVSIIVG